MEKFNAESILQKTLEAQEKAKAGGSGALEARFELNKLAEEANEHLYNEAKAESEKMDEKIEVPTEAPKKQENIGGKIELGESIEAMLAEKMKLFDTDRQEKLLIKNELKKKEKDIDIIRENNELAKKVGDFSAEQNLSNYSIDSILTALVDKNPANQMMGVDIIELAHRYNLPSVMFTASGHVKGEFAYKIVNDYLKKENIFNGIIAQGFSDCAKYSKFNVQKKELKGYNLLPKDEIIDNKNLPDLYYTTKIPEVNYFGYVKDFNASDNIELIQETYRDRNNKFKNFIAPLPGQKEDVVFFGWDENVNFPEIELSSMLYSMGVWDSVLQNVKAKAGYKDHYNILFVEDNPFNVDFAKIAFSEDLESGKVTLIHAPDYESAEKILNEKHSELDGVITDLYFPDKLGSDDKSHGEAVYKKIMAPFMKDPSKVGEMLDEVKAAYAEAYAKE
ncbi:MAG: hypothetical protein KBC98_01680 [Candidatus Pacebacteria bacterium]|nr:hypothetical protein [Candidatus Paceibacterota bacterium]